MVKLSRRLNQELETECGHTIEDILGRKSAKDFEQVLAVVADESATNVKRQNAIQVLGRWGDPVAVPAITAVMPSLDERGLINAIDALSHIGGADASRVVSKYAKSDSPDVRRFVVIGLERIGTKRALDKVATMAASDESGLVRARARRVLQDD